MKTYIRFCTEVTGWGITRLLWLPLLPCFFISSGPQSHNVHLVKTKQEFQVTARRSPDESVRQLKAECSVMQWPNTSPVTAQS
jgi:hypothetical protein